VSQGPGLVGNVRRVSIAEPAIASEAGTEAAGPSGRTRPRRRTDLLVAALCLALAGWVTGGLWLDPNVRAVRVNSGDQALFEWLLSYGAHALIHLQDPFFTHLLNIPDGVNLAVNTSITAYAIVFAPLTLLIGPPATFLVILTLNLAATGYAWYWLLSRHVVRSPLAAAVGGVFCGFAPGLVSHANAHLNWTAQWLIPLIVWRVLALSQTPKRLWRDGFVLGVLLAVTFTIAAEALFFTALALGLFLACWALARRAEARAAAPRFLAGLSTTGVVTIALLAYPLWLHFFGPQRYHGTGFDPRVHSEDIVAYGAFPQRSLAGLAGLATKLAPNPTEENSFFGVPLLLLTIACAVLLWRSATTNRAILRALLITAVVFAVLSFGPRIKWDRTITSVPLPYLLLGKLPVFDAALPARLALVVIPIVALLLAMTLDNLPRFSTRGRGLTLGAFAVALLPLVPVPLLTVDRSPVPRFITQGTWHRYVTAGGVLAPVPPTSDLLPDGQRWQAYALANRQGEFAIPAGFFLGPGGPDGRGRIGPVPRPTAALLAEVAQTGVVPIITDANRAQAREDLRYWHAQVVVLADRIDGAKWPVHRDAVLAATTELLGPGEHVTDVTLWRIPTS
jgi:hypothetical protein